MTEPRKIDSVQIKLLHIAKAKLKITDEEYRALLIKFSPTSWDMDPAHPSCKAMTYAEASALIDHLKAKGFKIVRRGGVPPTNTGQGDPAPTKRKLPPSITQMVTNEQLKMILHLKADIRWRIMPDGYDRWLKKYMQIERVATAKQAQKVIEALKAMKARQQNEDSIKAQQGQQFYDRPASEGGNYRW
ncbi:MAG: DUF1018 domain-containing protein [Nitrospirae bacterium]|nr:DUF1018 domain-containing protein [Nitrospirota bacterium]